MVKIKVMPTLKAKITEEQKTWLEKKAKKEGVYEAVIVRQVLDSAIRDEY